MYKTPEEMQEVIDKYFEECKGHILIDDEGKAILDKYNHPIIVDGRPPTMTGLALALGFTNRQSLLNYKARPAFTDTITRAKSIVERYTEERLFDKDGCNGAKFSLQFNFSGWREATPGEGADAAVVKIICDIPKAKVETENADGDE